jgi:hypothetical protein
MPRTYLVFGDIEGKLDVLRVECTNVNDGKNRGPRGAMRQLAGRDGGVSLPERHARRRGGQGQGTRPDLQAMTLPLNARRSRARVSARARDIRGTVRRRALAVFRLMPDRIWWAEAGDAKLVHV